MGWLSALRARIRLLARRDSEARIEEEFGFHIDMEAARLAREEGLPPDEARRRALVAFGGVERHKEALRDGRALAWVGGLSLDLRLAIRIFRKYPGLSLVGVVGMAVAVALGAIAFGLIYTLLDPPPVPLADGERVVAIHNIDVRRSDEARGTHLHDLVVWREAVPALAELGAFRTVDRNLVHDGGRPEPVRIAEMTASGFRIARVPPLLGRWLDDADEGPGAPPVVVLGHSLWTGRFAADSSIVGRTIRLGRTPHTVVGVMPRGFAFPINNRVWTPLRLNPSEFERGEAPAIDVFGRLHRGASLDDAATQLETIGRRLTSSFPATHEHVRPRVLPYARAFVESPEMSWMSHIFQLLVTMLLVVIGTNVAILVYARTASRAGEIALRSALGASRGRIVGQLFAEALVLSSVAAAAGLAIAWLALDRLNAYLDRSLGEQLPFWMEFGISGGMVAYIAAMAVLGAVIVGALPALKATRSRLQGTLQQASGGTAMRLGAAWTAMIVAQVALAVAVLPLATAGVALWAHQALAAPAVPPGEWMTATLHLDREDDAGAEAAEDEARLAARYASRQSELLRLVRAEPGVVAAVAMSSVPGEEQEVRIEVEGAAPSAGGAAQGGSDGHDAQLARVEPGHFGAFGIPLLAGRAFGDADAGAGAAAIVNRSFVQEILAGGEPLGRRIRRVVGRSDAEGERPTFGPWLEIVGVVPDFPNRVNVRFPEPRIYQPLVAGASRPATIAVRVRGGEPAELGGRLRELALGVDPMLRIGGVAALDESLHDRHLELRVLVGVVVLVTLSVLLLSAAGIYALVSFTVTRRRREIGIRAALGAGPRGIVVGVLSKVMRQIAIGIVVGSAVAWRLDQAMDGGFTGGRGAWLLLVVAAMMMVTGLLAAAGPARRALRIEPTEALKGE